MATFVMVMLVHAREASHTNFPGDLAVPVTFVIRMLEKDDTPTAGPPPPPPPPPPWVRACRRAPCWLFTFIMTAVPTSCKMMLL